MRLLRILSVWMAISSCMSFSGATADADTVYLKDGTRLEGFVEVEGEAYRDPASGQDVWMRKLGGFYLVKDYARRIIFSQRNVDSVEKSESSPPYEAYTISYALPHPRSHVITTVYEIKQATPWIRKGKDTGSRKLRIDTGQGPRKVHQAITRLTPHFVRAATRRNVWTCSFLTSEFGPELCLDFIRNRTHGKKRKEPVEEEFRLFRFCLQAKWAKEAGEQLDQIEKDFPNENARIQEGRAQLRELVDQQWASKVIDAHRAGQTQSTLKLLADGPKDGAEAKFAEIPEIRRNIEAGHAKVGRIRELLAEQCRQLGAAEMPMPFLECLREIARDLDAVNCDRLSAFEAIAEQQRRIDEPMGSAVLPPNEVLALALTGWIMGPEGAESSVDTALRLWRGRQLIMNYLRTVDEDKRRSLLPDYSEQNDSLDVDVMAQLVRNVPPAFLEAKIPKGRVELETLPASGQKADSYKLQLPPEYRHGRPFPLLVLVNNVNEKRDALMDRWAELAARHGYILAAPKWGDSFTTNYRFAEDEHVRDIFPNVIRDMRRRFHIDPDRVFIGGFSNAGTIVYDIALLNPDLFAGAIVMCGRVRFPTDYRVNAQHIPFYVVDGERDGAGPEGTRELFQFWVPKGYPAVYVEYTGRGFEFFPGELPYIFNWMNHQNRRIVAAEVGRPQPEVNASDWTFHVPRQTESRFHWLTTRGGHRVSAIKPGKLSARMAPNNMIFLRPQGLREITVWLNDAMLDLEQPVDIRVNSRTEFKGALKRDLGVLLEDYYHRGDPKNLFVAKKVFQWK